AFAGRAHEDRAESVQPLGEADTGQTRSRGQAGLPRRIGRAAGHQHDGAHRIVPRTGSQRQHDPLPGRFPFTPSRKSAAQVARPSLRQRRSLTLKKQFMAIRALYSAASGMDAMQFRLDVIANNLANAQTTAYKRSRVNFEDLYYQYYKIPGMIDQFGRPTSVGTDVGTGVRVQSTELDMKQGSLLSTGGQLD